MKAILYVLCTLLLFNTSCSKDSSNASLWGKWNWTSTSGGIFYQHYTPASTGRKIILELKRDNTFALYTNDTLTGKGTFSTTRTVDYYNGQKKHYIEFSNYVESNIIMEVTATTLQLGDGANDAFAYSYSRL